MTAVNWYVGLCIGVCGHSLTRFGTIRDSRIVVPVLGYPRPTAIAVTPLATCGWPFWRADVVSIKVLMKHVENQ